MGDRCCLSVRFRKEDTPKVRRFFHEEPATFEKGLTDNGDGTVTLEELEANYCCYQEREAIAAAGVVFDGSHGAGDDNGPALFCAFNGKCHNVDSLQRSCDPAVRVDLETGEICKKQFEEILAFIEARRKAVAYLKAGNCDKIRNASAEQISVC